MYFMQIVASALVIAFGVSIAGMVVALVEPGWKRFQDEKASNPQLKFNAAYIVNMILTAGGVGTLLAIIAAIIVALKGGETSIEVDFFAIIGQFGLGYLISYRILDA